MGAHRLVIQRATARRIINPLVYIALIPLRCSFQRVFFVFFKDGTEGTDLEYEQPPFIYPNGFVDQNGIYYVQNFDPFPMVIYNPGPMCYPEYPNTKYTKRYSTDSLVSF